MLSELKTYRENLEEELENVLSKCGSISHVEAMLRHLCFLQDCIDKLSLSDDDATEWVNSMMNEDGTKGPHWSLEETKSFKRSSSVSDKSWDAAMNMMYSDYYKVAEKYGVNKPDFYADLAEAFLNDKDAGDGESKLAHYYYGIVE
jgi:hypothetical protein